MADVVKMIAAALTLEGAAADLAADLAFDVLVASEHDCSFQWYLVAAVRQTARGKTEHDGSHLDRWRR